MSLLRAVRSHSAAKVMYSALSLAAFCCFVIMGDTTLCRCAQCVLQCLYATRVHSSGCMSPRIHQLTSQLTRLAVEVQEGAIPVRKLLRPRRQHPRVLLLPRFDLDLEILFTFPMHYGDYPSTDRAICSYGHPSTAHCHV